MNLGLVLLLTEVDLIPKNQDCKRYAWGACSNGRVKIILELLIEVVALHVEATIVQVGFLGLNGSILEDGVCFALFLALNKQF